MSQTNRFPKTSCFHLKISICCTRGCYCLFPRASRDGAQISPGPSSRTRHPAPPPTRDQRPGNRDPADNKRHGLVLTESKTDPAYLTLERGAPHNESNKAENNSHCADGPVRSQLHAPERNSDKTRERCIRPPVGFYEELINECNPNEMKNTALSETGIVNVSDDEAGYEEVEQRHTAIKTPRNTDNPKPSNDKRSRKPNLDANDAKGLKPGSSPLPFLQQITAKIHNFQNQPESRVKGSKYNQPSAAQTSHENPGLESHGYEFIMHWRTKYSDKRVDDNVQPPADSRTSENPLSVKNTSETTCREAQLPPDKSKRKRNVDPSSDKELGPWGKQKQRTLHNDPNESQVTASAGCTALTTTDSQAKTCDKKTDNTEAQSTEDSFKVKVAWKVRQKAVRKKKKLPLEATSSTETGYSSFRSQLQSALQTCRFLFNPSVISTMVLRVPGQNASWCCCCLDFGNWDVDILGNTTQFCTVTK